MKRVDQTVVAKNRHPEIYNLLDQNAVLANNLYNAVLFRIRQVFTGWDKTARTANEAQVFCELEQTEAVYPKLHIRRVLTWTVLDKVLRVTNNPDYFSGLPMQTAEAVVKQAAADFKNWLKALKEYKKHPEKYLGKPRMPHYRKKGHTCTYTITNQDAVLYPVYDENHSYIGRSLKLPKTSKRLRLSHIPEDAVLKEVKVSPYYGKYIISLTFDVEEVLPAKDLPNMAGLDLGTDNIAAIVTTDHSSIVYKGGAVMAENRLFAKEKAGAVSEITKGTMHTYADSKHLRYLSLRHSCFMNDQMHKISKKVIQYLLDHRVGCLIIGKNPLWKQNVSLGARNNQNFVSIPHARLTELIIYKANMAGITVVTQEESFTSRADCTSNDRMPVYGDHTAKEPEFSGKRISRGRYRTGSGMIINADCNGAANILRKAFPEAFAEVTDFSFLKTPEAVRFKDLNSCRNAVA